MPDVELPLGQFVQVALPVAGLYVPVAHAVQDPPSEPEYPTLHVQSVNASLVAGEFELAGHPRHAPVLVAPGVIEYLPVPHAVHAWFATKSLYFPSGHWLHVCAAAGSNINSAHTQYNVSFNSRRITGTYKTFILDCHILPLQIPTRTFHASSIRSIEIYSIEYISTHTLHNRCSIIQSKRLIPRRFSKSVATSGIRHRPESSDS